MPRDFETMYYEQQAQHTEAMGMEHASAEHWKARAERAEELLRGIAEAHGMRDMPKTTEMIERFLKYTRDPVGYKNRAA